MPRKADPRTLKFQFKPLPVPDSIETTFTDWQTICVPVPIPLIPYLTPIMRIWQSPGCLIGTDTEKELFILLWSNLIASINGGDECASMFKLRQNSANKCLLQQSTDGGATWSTAFDYSLCRPAGNNYLIEREVYNQWQVWQNAVQPSDIHPDAPDTTFTSTTGDSPEVVNARQIALCNACKEYVYAYCEAVRIINADASTASNLVTMGLGIAAAIAAIAAAPSGGSSLALYMALSAALLAGGVAAYSALTDAVLDDTDAKDSVACCLYATLRDAAITAENFAEGVNVCPDLSVNAELIRATLANDISNPEALENQFNSFVEKLGQNFRPAELGLLDDCLCIVLEPGTPIIALSWEGVDLAGTGITEVSPGLWEITSTLLPSTAHSITIQEAGGGIFELYDFSYPDGINASVHLARLETGETVDLGATTGTTVPVDRYGWIWVSIVPIQRVNFRIRKYP